MLRRAAIAGTIALLVLTAFAARDIAAVELHRGAYRAEFYLHDRPVSPDRYHTLVRGNRCAPDSAWSSWPRERVVRFVCEARP